MEGLRDDLTRALCSNDQVFVCEDWNGDSDKLAVTLIFSHNLVTLHNALLLRFGLINARKLQIEKDADVVHGSLRFRRDTLFRLLNTLLVRVLLCNQILRRAIQFLRKAGDKTFIHGGSWKQILVLLRGGLWSRIYVFVLHSLLWHILGGVLLSLHWNEVFIGLSASCTSKVYADWFWVRLCDDVCGNLDILLISVWLIWGKSLVLGLVFWGWAFGIWRQNL